MPTLLNLIHIFFQDSRFFQPLLKFPDLLQCTDRENESYQPEYDTCAFHVTPPYEVNER
jgi:hypothetical protein